MGTAIKARNGVNARKQDQLNTSWAEYRRKEQSKVRPNIKPVSEIMIRVRKIIQFWSQCRERWWVFKVDLAVTEVERNYPFLGCLLCPRDRTGLKVCKNSPSSWMALEIKQVEHTGGKEEGQKLTDMEKWENETGTGPLSGFRGGVVHSLHLLQGKERVVTALVMVKLGLMLLNYNA